MKIGKSIILVTAFLGYSVSVLAQQLDYSQYYVNLPTTNPGFTGIDDFLDLKAGVREGWNDFDDDNTSAYISAFGTLNKPLKHMIRSNSLRISDPGMFNKIASNRKLRRKHGLGGVVSTRKLGPYQSTQLALNYAYHLPISKKLNWSFGTQVGYLFQKVDFSGYTLRNEVDDQFYQALLSSNEGQQGKLGIDFGTVIYTSKLYLGFSSSNLIVKNVSSDNILQEQSNSRFRMQMGYNFDISPNIEMNLAGAGVYYEGIDPTVMLNSRVRFKKIVYIGAGYEHDKRVSLLFGLTSEGKFSLNYSYDKFISQLTDFNVNSHEVVIGVTVFNKYNLTQKFW
ncbi:type IX secretion system membrane protein PorP/SprF [Fulvivirga sp. RKSG066]|uniref:PorP/SprF family type IX secretion system membrane protein n=1 Tax=Fulvivirga aurantia TaxID=2529383 RepID=UPI0012BCCC99|nr:PorP/SprF family type IX secretion system membrane protein [Fulvivirga aurantia]MTI20254.1 type IX secretion system membrane protein PorP/SprF [Fulvivirga aurantia]